MNEFIKKFGFKELLHSELIDSNYSGEKTIEKNNNYVFEKTNDNTFVLIPVKVGNSSNGFTEIIDSEKVVEKKIVEKGSYDLLMALKNQVQE